MSKNWFPHDYHARTDARVMHLLSENGARAYGVFWCVVEILHTNHSDVTREQLAKLVLFACGDREQSAVNDINNVLNQMFDLQLLCETNGKVYNERVMRNLKERNDITDKKRDAANKRWEGINTDKNADAMHVHKKTDAGAMPLHYTTLHNSTTHNNSLEREGVSDDPPHPHPDDHIDTLSLEVKTEPQKKESLRGRFVKPIPYQLREFFTGLGSTPEEATRFFNYYESNGWRVGRGGMKDWKASARNWIDRDLTRHTHNQQQPRQKTTQGDRYNGVSQAEYERMIDIATRPDYNPNQLENGNNGTDPNNIGRIES